MAFRLPDPQGDSPLVSPSRSKSLIEKLQASMRGEEPAAQRVGMPSQQSLIGSSVSGQMGGQPQFNLFGADKFGNQKFELFPSSEPREYFGPLKEAVDRENRLKGGKDFRQGRLSREGLFEAHRGLDGTAKNKIFKAYTSGDISKEQATSLATRIQDYFNTKTQQDIFSDLIGQKEEQPIKPKAPRSRPNSSLPTSRGSYEGSLVQPGVVFSSSYV
tara:strand:+ start:2420 stop:3067 length:648 start_codon:yes stop_codon:yes gene_type:complete